jgi:glycosidase
MKKISFLLTVILCCALSANAQLLSWSPNFITETTTNNEITLDANFGNKALLTYTPVTDVYLHMGVITSSSTSQTDWRYSRYMWGTTTAGNATSLGNGKWRFTITSDLRTFFGITNASEKILRIALLFRSGNGNTVQRNADGSDMYIPVYDNTVAVRIDNPLRIPSYKLGNEIITKNVNDNIAIEAKSNQAANLKIFLNGTEVANAANATSISANPTITATGNYQIIAEANASVRDTINFLVAPPVNIAPLPTGVRDGINYEADPTAVTLVVHAPGKNNIAVIGDFNNWTETVAHQMNKTPDGNKFWIRLTGLTSGQEYGFQYKIDNSLIVGDAYAEKVLDPWNDGFIPTTTYPSLKPYPTGKTSGIVSIFQTNKPAFAWQVPNFTRPNKKNLIIYEMLIRDFTAAKTYTSIKDTISYLKRLGINCLQLMPIMEFDGNLSWGYNPSYFFAPDKFYGTETAFKQLVDECHKNGIAVVLDIAMNHATGANPLAAMYWDAANSRPAANNPWFNTTARHPFNVFNDFNHESAVTQEYTARVIRHWLTNYKIDGFRWDLSKGFTQLNSGSDVGLWSNYDANRVALWKRYYDSMMAVSPNSYCILEHFAANSEENELSNYGMLLWGNLNHAFREAAKGNSGGSDFSSIYHTVRSWSQPHLIGYAESHDEDRIVFDAVNNGRTVAGYNIRDTTIALKRAEMAAAFLAMVPGPKMIWQWGELGYHFSINRCVDGTINNDCRLAEKPLFWNEKFNINRAKLYDVYAKLFALRNNPAYINAFTTNTGGFNNSAGFVKQLGTLDPSLRINVFGNFDVVATTVNIPFPTNGMWFDVLRNTFVNISGNALSLTLQPGDYYVFVDKNVNNIPTSILNPGYNLANFNIKLSPNPLQTTSLLQYDVLESGKVTVQVIDINGKIVSQLFSGFKTRGIQQLQINKNALGATNGMCFIQVDINGKKQTQKLTIVN